jgi:hypothetical protein
MAMDREFHYLYNLILRHVTIIKAPEFKIARHVTPEEEALMAAFKKYNILIGFCNFFPFCVNALFMIKT